MVNLNLVISILFWLPVTAVILYNLVWDLRFYQRNNFSLKHIYHSIRWDFETSHRSQYKLIIKLLLFVAIITFLLNPLSVWPAFAILGLYILWCSEMFIVIEKIYLKKIPYVQMNWRAVTVVLLTVGFLSIFPILFTLSILQSPSTAPVITSIAELLPTETVLGVQTPSIYLYLIFSTLLALTYDLTSAAIVLAMVIVTKPLAWLERRIKRLKAKNKLLLYPNLIIVGITGSTGKTTTKQILEHILGNKFKVVSTPYSQVNELALLDTIINYVNHDTEILIIEMNAYRTGDIAKLCKIAQPHISILTGVDESHIGMFGSLEKTLAVKAEILKGTRTNGTVILNGDDENVRELISKYDLKEIVVYTKAEVGDTLANNNLTLNYYHAHHIHHDKDKDLEMGINSGLGSFELKLQDAPKFLVIPTLCAMAAAGELGVSANDIISAVETYKHPSTFVETILGDGSAVLWVDDRPQNFRSFKQAMEYILKNDTPETKIVLVTNGLKQLGKYKSDVYKDLVEAINSNVDALITTDSHLAKASKKNNFRTRINLLNGIEDIIYAARHEIEPDTKIMLLGDLDLKIVEELSV